MKQKISYINFHFKIFNYTISLKEVSFQELFALENYTPPPSPPIYRFQNNEIPSLSSSNMICPSHFIDYILFLSVMIYLCIFSAQRSLYFFSELLLFSFFFCSSISFFFFFFRLSISFFSFIFQLSIYFIFFRSKYHH